MTIRSIDAKSALVVIDLQKGIVAANLDYGSAAVVENSALLAREFRARGLPVVWVNVTGQPKVHVDASLSGGPKPDDWADLVPELGVEPGDICVTKQSIGAFTNTGLEKTLRDLGVTEVVFTGLVTSIGVEGSLRQAYELGFNAAVAVDAVADYVPVSHENSLKRIFPHLAECGTTADIIAKLPG